jgi:hypothetical protein
MAHPGEVVTGHRAVGAYPRHDDLVSPSESSNGMRHTFTDTNDQVSEGNVSIHFYEGPPMGPSNDDIIRGMRIVRKDVILEARKGFFSYCLS